MDRAELNGFNKLLFRDPCVALKELRQIELLPTSDLVSEKVLTLRTNDLKNVKEYRHAALFCYGMTIRNNQDIRFCPTESSDYDFIATWESEEIRHYAPVQLKELPPIELNATLTTQELIDSLIKYSDPTNLTFVIVLNRNEKFEPSKLDFSKLNAAALWFVATTSQDHSKWLLWGNFMGTPDITSFAYPT